MTKQPNMELELFKSDDLKVLLNDEAILGIGSFGITRLGFHDYHGIVAVKCSKMHGGWKNLNLIEETFKNEIELVQRTRHKNIVNVYGWTHWPGNIAIIMEYLPRGNLLDALQDHDISLHPLLRLRMCYETANAIGFIHNISSNKPFVHGNIKAEQVLLTNDLHCKLTDFESSRIFALKCGSTVTNCIKLTDKFYVSPEFLEHPTDELKQPHDTYSFAVTMFILIGRGFPVLSEKQMISYIEGVKNGQRLNDDVIMDFIHELKEEGSNSDVEVIFALKELMEKCWSQNPLDRPPITGVKQSLYELLNRQDSVKIQRRSIDATNLVQTQKLSRGLYECVPLHQFSADDNNFTITTEERIDSSIINIETDFFFGSSILDSASIFSSVESSSREDENLITSSPRNIENLSGTEDQTGSNHLIAASQIFSPTSEFSFLLGAALPGNGSANLSKEVFGPKILAQTRGQPEMAENQLKNPDDIHLIENAVDDYDVVSSCKDSTTPGSYMRNKRLLSDIKQQPENHALIRICKEVMEISDDDFTAEVVANFPPKASVCGVFLSSDDVKALSFVMTKLNRKIDEFVFTSCDLTSAKFQCIVEAFNEMTGSVDYLDIRFNKLSPNDMDGICSIIKKINVELRMLKCFASEKEKWKTRLPNEAEIEKLQETLNSLENNTLVISVGGGITLRKTQQNRLISRTKVSGPDWSLIQARLGVMFPKTM